MNYMNIAAAKAYEQVSPRKSRIIREIAASHEQKPSAGKNTWYDINVLNTSMPAQEIVDMVNAALEYDKQNDGEEKGIRMFFYGVSGGGKSMLARHITKSLGLELLTKNASDIFSRWSGEAEQNIAAAFKEAQELNKVLIFDEADSYFMERDGNGLESWQISQVNEFLTQMENYKGILICTSNLRSLMDKAAQRRFHIMVEFKPLSDTGVKTLLKTYFSEFNFSQDQIQSICKTQSATPGDFGVLFDRMRFLKTERKTSSYITQELCKMQEEKNCGHRKIGF